jgi:hypothetical protein
MRRVSVDHGVDQSADELGQWCRGIVQKCLADDAVDFVKVALVERRQDGPLVREILVDRADADAGDPGNAVGVEGVDPFALQDSHRSVEHRFYGLDGTALLGTAARRASFASGGHVLTAYTKYEHEYIFG